LVTDAKSAMRDGNENDFDSALASVAAGEIEALEHLYRGLRVAVFAVALAVVGDRPSAEDVVHDTFVRVYEQADRYRPGTRARAWVLAIARNLAIDAVRRRDRKPRFEEIRQTPEDEPLAAVSWTQALMTLDVVDREIVVLHALGGLTHQEIAAQVRLPPGTVRWRYRAALARLAPSVSETRDA
jgi:RNA polymerase sigma-70 factor (ECF subfamily)